MQKLKDDTRVKAQNPIQDANEENVLCSLRLPSSLWDTAALEIQTGPRCHGDALRGETTRSILLVPPPPSVLCGAFTWLLERTQTLRSSHQVPGEHSWVPGSIVSVLSEYLLQLLRSTLLALQKFSFSL